jgi:hypothetical protein
MSENKCKYPNCQNMVEHLFANRKMLYGPMFDKIAVCAKSIMTYYYSLTMLAKTVKSREPLIGRPTIVNSRVLIENRDLEELEEESVK